MSIGRGSADNNEEDDVSLPQFHSGETGEDSPRTPDSSTAESKTESYNYVIRSAKPSDAELQSLNRDSYVLVNTGEKAWELYYIGAIAGKKALVAPTIPTLLPKLMEILPANANKVEADKNKRTDIQKLIKNEKSEYELLKACEEFYKNEREFHNTITKFLRDCALVFGKVGPKRKNELDIYLDRYKVLEKNLFPEQVDVSDAKSTLDKAEKYVSVMLEGMGRSKSFNDAFMMMEEIESSYPDFQKDWLTLSDKAAEPLVAATTATGYKTVLEAKQNFSNNSAAGYQHKIKVMNVMNSIMQNLNKRYPESPLNGKLEKQSMLIKELARKANDDKNFMIRAGILGKISDAIAEAKIGFEKSDSYSRNGFKAFHTKVVAKMREVQAENVSPDHVASFFYADFIKMYMNLYVHAGHDKTQLNIMQKFIIDIDKYLADHHIMQVIGAQNKKPEEIDKNIFETLNKEVYKRIENSEYEYQRSAEKMQTASSIQENHAKEFTSGLVRYLFDEAKLALGEHIEDKESDESMKEVSGTEARKSNFINARKAIVQMGRSAINQWNALAGKEFLELKISPDAAELIKREQEDAFKKLTTLEKTEQKRTQALVDVVINTFADAMLEMKSIPLDDRQILLRSIDRFKKIDVNAQDKIQVRKNLQDILIDINAFGYQIGRRKGWTLHGKDSLAQDSLIAVQNFIRNVDKKLVSQGQQPLIVDSLDQQKSAPVENAVMIFNRLPKVLGADFEKYVNGLYAKVKSEIRKIEPMINEWLSKVSELAKEKLAAESIKDPKTKKSSLSEIEKKYKALDKEFKNLSELEGGAIYKIRMELVNTLKMIERMGLTPEESKAAKDIWNKAFDNDPEKSTLLAYTDAIEIAPGKVLKKGDTEIHESHVKTVFDKIVNGEVAAYKDQFKQERGYGFTFIGRPSISSSSPAIGNNRSSTMNKSPMIPEDDSSSDEEFKESNQSAKRSSISIANKK